MKGECSSYRLVIVRFVFVRVHGYVQVSMDYCGDYCVGYKAAVVPVSVECEAVVVPVSADYGVVAVSVCKCSCVVFVNVEIAAGAR